MQQVWANNVTTSGVNYASMLNTGNFVLARQDYVNLWESFNAPIDTILPTQVPNQGGILVSHVSETNYSSGNFQFLLQSDGDLVLSLVDVTHNFVRYKYWESNTLGTGF
ncbi:g-type lectin s-receptor-like serine/threonine-protein kinase lecrk2 [Quercus suber]|uniref:G-type lectin s-receptor-like serine/threonine-protein kinase lecrk2 n=1 Tax=Quercus suber TaxID=58331 RepID=A0AAW0LXT5_QUESU